MRKSRIALIVVVSVVVLLLVGAIVAGRSLFAMPTATKVDSVVGELDGERVLGVFAHPDDEQTVNGLFWRAKDLDGAYTAMVTATRGEAGEQVPFVARQGDLGAVREAEALKNSFNLGVDEHEVWDYPDGGVPDVDEEELVERLAATMRRVRPDVVVGFWPASGATGHLDHREMGRVTELAIARLAEEGGSYRGPDHLVYTISPTKALEMFGGEQGRLVVENQPDPEYAMSAEVGKKKEGWKIHASQEDYLQASYGLPTWLVYLLWDQEFYHVRDLVADPLA
ncbi:PIG-L deacetylase family protein [Isoptericola rhizosphaerae]|uniref:PIG-L deacetylase family protein n=1 Tax=Isoptericola rhizosphaerae TaxID=3377837 RepID=UPI003839F654